MENELLYKDIREDLIRLGLPPKAVGSILGKMERLFKQQLLTIIGELEKEDIHLADKGCKHMVVSALREKAAKL